MTSQLNPARPDPVGATGEKSLVGFLGPTASYSHQATLQVFPESSWKLRPASTITDVFDLVQDRQVLKGVVPFENSSNGCVVVTLDNLADRDGRYKDITVEGEIFVDVRHCLLGKKAAAVGEDNSTVENMSFGHIKQIYSHPQAIGQCRKFIARNLKDAEINDVSSTSRAAEIVRKNDTESSAAISSRLTADVYGLDILAESIQDRDDNMTRFLIIRSLQSDSRGAPAIANPSISSDEIAADTKSLVSFTVPHSSPGALADVLHCFKESGLNLTSINSRPSLQAPFQYVFFVEFHGHRYARDGKVERVLEQISRVAESSRWLGSWTTCR